MIERITYLLVMVSLCLLPLVGIFSIDSTDCTLLKRPILIDDEINEEYELMTSSSPEVQEAYEKYKESYGYASYAFETASKTEGNDKSEIKFTSYTPNAQLTEDEIKKMKDSGTTNKDTSLLGISSGSVIGTNGYSGSDYTDITSGDDDDDEDEQYYTSMGNFEINDNDDGPNYGEDTEFNTNVVFIDGDDDDDDDPHGTHTDAVVLTGNLQTQVNVKTTK